MIYCLIDDKHGRKYYYNTFQEIEEKAKKLIEIEYALFEYHNKLTIICLLNDLISLQVEKIYLNQEYVERLDDIKAKDYLEPNICLRRNVEKCPADCYFRAIPLKPLNKIYLLSKELSELINKDTYETCLNFERMKEIIKEICKTSKETNTS
jgi:hypothetical protein